MSKVIAREVQQRLHKFERWLKSRGAEILINTNQYELIRFRGTKGTSIVYRKDNLDAAASFFNEAEDAWCNYLVNGPWRAILPTPRQAGHRNGVEMRTIRARDGNDCFFCCEYVTEHSATIEHLVALGQGGPQHISNKFLAHGECNMRAGNISAPEKIKIHTDALLRKNGRKVYEPS